MKKRRKRTNKNIPAKGRLRDIADELWSVAVREDWDHKCAVCGREKCEAHHLIPRQHQVTRYDILNGIALCATCHQFCPNLSPHQNAAGWLAWLKEHHTTHHNAYVRRTDTGSHKKFYGIVNPAYYCDVILELQFHVPEEDYVRIVGKKFSQYLEEQE